MHEHKAVAPRSSERRWGLCVSEQAHILSSCGRMERCATVGTPRALCRAKIGGGCTTPRDLVWEARAVSRVTSLDLCYWVTIADEKIAKSSNPEFCCEPCRDVQMCLNRLIFVEHHPCPDDICPTGHRGDGVASFHYGEGWLASSWLFAEVRRKLQQTQPTWSSQVDFPAARPEDLLPDLAGACESPITLLSLGFKQVR